MRSSFTLEQVPTWVAQVREAGHERPLVSAATIGAVVTLGWVRVATGAEFSFASLSLLPVLVAAWWLGRPAGLFLAALAAVAWLVGDLASERSFSAPWVPWINAAVHLLTYGLAALLAVEIRGRFDSERERADRDALTRLYNRRAFFARGERLVARARAKGLPLAIVFIDLDNFKQINDSRGHEVGDDALCATARALQQASRSHDLLARLGGDEFVLLLPEVDGQWAMRAAERLQASARAALGAYTGLSASVGVACFERVERPLSELLAEADGLMLRAKRQGKDALVMQGFATGAAR